VTRTVRNRGEAEKMMLSGISLRGEFKLAVDSFTDRIVRVTARSGAVQLP
jgi:hypothetical protein